MGELRPQYHSRHVRDGTHVWDVRRLARMAAGLVPERVALADLSELDENWWYDDGDRVPTPRAITDHMRLVLAVDPRFPIILCAEGRLMDGMHRIISALLRGEDTISAVRFPVTPPPDHRNVPLSALPHEQTGRSSFAGWPPLGPA